jgi:DNA (cytosine-5)-methyltransferase 1
MTKAKYSVLRKTLDLKPEKDEQNTQAALTHYLQSGEEEYLRLVSDDGLAQYNTKLADLKADASFLDLRLGLEWDIPFPPPTKPKFTFIDLFAGIGGIRLAYQREGGKCVFSSEWNKYAKITYEANFGEVPFGDITIIDEKLIPDHDILLGGFPCQPFSIAGVSKKNALGRAHGFLDETQGTLFFDIARIIDFKRPKAFMLENVKNLVSHDKGKTFKIISKTLRELGYSIHFKVLDSKHFVPQHRERIIIVGFNEEIFVNKEQFEFPELPEPIRKVKEIIDPAPDSKYTLTENLWQYLQNYAQKHKEKGNGFGFGLVDMDGITRTISARYYKDGSEALIPQCGKIPRRLTPRECARLQGYPDNFLIPVSDMQAYKQFGNSVTVPLINAVGKSIVKTLLSNHEPTKT